MTIDVRRLGPEDAGERSDFLASVPGSLVYASPQFGRFLSRVVPGEELCLAARGRNGLRGLLPLFRARHPELGCVVNSLPWFGSHGGCTLADPADAEARRALLEAYRELACADDVVAATLVLTPSEERWRDHYTDVLAPRFTDGRIGQITALPEPGERLEERLMRRFRTKTRNLVRKGLKQGFELLVEDADWAWRFLHETHVENMEAVGGTPKPRSHLDALRDVLPAEWRRLYVATAEGEPVAAVLVLLFNQTAEYVTPVIRVEQRPRQPLSFLVWHAMCHAVEAGLRWWNWGGTWHSQKSLHHFKAGWGADDRPYSYLVNVSDRGLARLREGLGPYRDAFPFYYLAPFHELRAG